METLDELELAMEMPLNLLPDFWQLLLRCIFNMAVVWVIIHFQYYSKSKRSDYYFTFMLISLSIFMLIFLLGGVKLKIGFALGLFAIFGIIRYRTESMPVREMTYLFVIIAISVINALAITLNIYELLCTNAIFIIAIAICESNLLFKHLSCKLIQYDKIELIKPEHEQELLEDVKNRTGLNITRIEIGAIDFLRDMAMLKVYYIPSSNKSNSIDSLIKISKEQWTGSDS